MQKLLYNASDLQATPQDHQIFHEHLMYITISITKRSQKQISINAAKNIQTIRFSKKQYS